MRIHVCKSVSLERFKRSKLQENQGKELKMK